MKSSKINFFFLGFILLTISSIAQEKRCGAAQYDSVLSRRYANWVFQRRALQDSVTAYLNQNNRRARVGEICANIRIPVVVHVIHDNAAGVTGGRDNPNLSDAQIQNQIRILNEDYRRKTGTPGFNTNAVGADAGIEFYLANIDPNGQRTTGITRHNYPQKTNFSILSDDQLISEIVSWPSDRYLNIWTARFGTGTFLGISQFPSVSGVKGLDQSTELQERSDGVFIDFRVFGTGGSVVSRLYKSGRTTTHEVGHWLGLVHTWGDTFCGDDYCADTPVCEGGNQGVTCGPIFSNCTGTRTRNMTENYMDYSPDSCMSVFTKNQAERMKAVLEKAPRRARLVRYWCAQLPFGQQLQLEIYPNPAANDLNFKVTLKEFGTFDVEVFDLTGKLVYQSQFVNYPSWVVNLSAGTIAPGAYLVRVKTKDESVTKRLIISR